MVFGRKKTPQSVRNPKITSQNEEYSFRRSRTLTGSATDSARSATEDHSQLRSTRLKTHDLRHHRRRLTFYLLSSLLVVCLLGWTITQFVATTTVSTTQSDGVIKPLDNSAYETSLRSYYDQHPFERFRFALDHETLTSFMQQEHPEVASASVVVSDNQIGHAALELQLRRPVVTWTVGTTKYYVDADGQSFGRNYYVEPSVTVEDKSGINQQASGSLIASSRFLHFIGRVIALVDASGLTTVTHVQLPPNTSREVDLSLSNHTYLVKTQLDRDPAGQATDVINAIKFLNGKGLTPGYVDVRVSSKAFYK